MPTGAQRHSSGTHAGQAENRYGFLKACNGIIANNAQTAKHQRSNFRRCRRQCSDSLGKRWSRCRRLLVCSVMVAKSLSVVCPASKAERLIGIARLCAERAAVQVIGVGDQVVTAIRDCQLARATRSYDAAARRSNVLQQLVRIKGFKASTAQQLPAAIIFDQRFLRLLLDRAVVLAGWRYRSIATSIRIERRPRRNARIGEITTTAQVLPLLCL